MVGEARLSTENRVVEQLLTSETDPHIRTIVELGRRPYLLILFDGQEWQRDKLHGCPVRSNSLDQVIRSIEMATGRLDTAIRLQDDRTRDEALIDGFDKRFKPTFVWLNIVSREMDILGLRVTPLCTIKPCGATCRMIMCDNKLVGNSCSAVVRHITKCEMFFSSLDRRNDNADQRRGEWHLVSTRSLPPQTMSLQNSRVCPLLYEVPELDITLFNLFLPVEVLDGTNHIGRYDHFATCHLGFHYRTSKGLWPSREMNERLV